MKNSTILENQDFTNYLQKVVEFFITTGPILTGKSCEKWDCGCKIASSSSSHINTWLRNRLQSSKILIQIQYSRY